MGKGNKETYKKMGQNFIKTRNVKIQKSGQ